MMQKLIHGGDVYSFQPKADFSANINPLGVPGGVLAAVQACGKELANYPDPLCRALKKAVAEKEQVKEELLIFGNGAAELIFSLVWALRPKKAVLMAPGFAEYEQALTGAGCEISWYELAEEQGFVPEKRYFDLLTEDVDMAFVCCPNNPTGICPDPSFLKKTLELCEQHHIFLVVDECFIEFLDEPESCSVKSYLADSENLFVLKAFTKLYAMPGLRLGYGLCKNAGVLEQMNRVMQPWSVSIPAQKAGVAALKEETYVKKARALIKTERERLYKGLLSLGLKAWYPAANFVFFKGPKGLDEKIRQEGFLIRDCSNYHGLEEGFYRIAVRLPEENTEFLEALQRVLK